MDYVTIWQRFILGLRGDRYVRFTNMPHQRLLVTLCRAMGLDTAAFGDPSRGAGPLPEVLS